MGEEREEREERERSGEDGVGGWWWVAEHEDEDSMMRGLSFVSFVGEGLVRYASTQRLQERLARHVKLGALPSLVLALEHKPVITLGKRGTERDLLEDRKDILRRGVDVEVSTRGGEVTFHGPGQVVMYPIISLRDWKIGARKYVESLEDAIIGTLRSYGIEGRGRVPGATGVWVEDRKIAAIGVRISQGISTHGLALNVDPDLSSFSSIIPCGLKDKEVTSMRKEMQLDRACDSSSTTSLASSTPPAPTVSDVQDHLFRNLSALLGAKEPLTLTERELDLFIQARSECE